MLEEIRTHPTVVGELPSVSDIARLLLLNFSPWDSKTDWVIEAKDWHPTIDELEDLEGSVLVSDLDIDDEGRDIVREYIEGLLRPSPETEEESLSKLLGYKINAPYPLRPDLREREAREREIHLQRTRDILGPEVWDMKRRCKERGIFHDGLSVERFFELVDSNTNTEAKLEDTKRTVELKMRHFVAMVEENEGVFSAAEEVRAREMKARLGVWEGVKWEVGEREE
jgi:hypothetical protein